MHDLIASYWWAFVGAMVSIMALFVFIAGRGAEGGFGGRTRLGWSKWRAVSKKAGDVQARVILTIFYFTVAAPFGLVRTHLNDPLQIKKRNRPRSWHPRHTRDLTLDDARRQF
jgi:hypothetical protein